MQNLAGAAKQSFSQMFHSILCSVGITNLNYVLALKSLKFVQNKIKRIWKLNCWNKMFAILMSNNVNFSKTMWEVYIKLHLHPCGPHCWIGVRPLAMFALDTKKTLVPANLLICSKYRQHGKLAHVVFEKGVKLLWKYHPWQDTAKVALIRFIENYKKHPEKQTVMKCLLES